MLKTITCINVASYRNALTRGKRYEMLEINDGQGQVRLFGDNGRKRWYPANLFDFENNPISILERFCLDDPDPLDDPFNASMEVTVKLSTGELRWCLFVTPKVLTQNGEFVPGTAVRFHYDIPNLIIVNEITPEIIENALKHIDSQNLLIRCSLALKADD